MDNDVRRELQGAEERGQLMAEGVSEVAEAEERKGAEAESHAEAETFAYMEADKKAKAASEKD